MSDDEIILPPFPDITDSEMLASFEALVQAGNTYRAVLYELVAKELMGLSDTKKRNHPAMQLLVENERVLDLADKILNLARDQYGLTFCKGERVFT